MRHDSAAAADPQKSTVLENAARAQYLDPRLFAADVDYYHLENILVHAKTLDVEHLDSVAGPYSSIYAMAEVRDDEAVVPVLIEITDDLMQLVDIPLAVDECYRIYGYVGSYQTVPDPVTGVEHALPTLVGYHFEPLASDGFEGCESP
jgi:hypothetical protein